MRTEDIILVAVAINLIIAVLAVVIPRVRNRRSAVATSDAAPFTATRVTAAGGNGASTNGNGSHHRSGSADDAGAPWFPTRSLAASTVGPPTDPVTGLDLGPAWARWLTEEEARVQRFHRPATIVLVELSGLDRLAERLGDEAAGRLIPPIAMTMRKNARATDHLARLGPTRFGAILTETDEIRAIIFIERIRSACDVWLEAGAVSLRLSMGWAEISVNQPVDPAIIAAERRLNVERGRLRGQETREIEDDRDVMAAQMRPARAN